MSEEKRTELQTVLSEFSDSFSDEPGKTTLTKHGIHLQPGTTPIKLSPYRVSSAKADVIKKELDDMLKLGVIEPSTSPWSAPVVLIPKPDKTLHFCVDYRRLNKVTIPDAFPMPRIDDLIDKVGKATIPNKDRSFERLLASSFRGGSCSDFRIRYTVWSFPMEIYAIRITERSCNISETRTQSTFSIR